MSPLIYAGGSPIGNDVKATAFDSGLEDLFSFIWPFKQACGSSRRAIRQQGNGPVANAA